MRDPWGKARRGLRVGTRLNRQDYGINYNKLMDAGGMVVGNMVDAEADLELVKK